MAEECRRAREHAGLVLIQAQTLLDRLDRAGGRLTAHPREAAIPPWMPIPVPVLSDPGLQALAA